MATYNFVEISAIESAEAKINYLAKCDDVEIINGKVINIKLKDPTKDRIATFIRLNKNVPQYLNDGTQADPNWVLGECKNIYTSIYSLDAILKGMGEIIGSKLLNTKKSPELALARIFGGAVIHAAGVHYKRGDYFSNPFGDEVSKTMVEHDLIKYYIYSVKLDAKSMASLHAIADTEMIREMMIGEEVSVVDDDTVE
jgi:hypothetical protein